MFVSPLDLRIKRVEAVKLHIVKSLKGVVHSHEDQFKGMGIKI